MATKTVKLPKPKAKMPSTPKKTANPKAPQMKGGLQAYLKASKLV